MNIAIGANLAGKTAPNAPATAQQMAPAMGHCDAAFSSEIKAQFRKAEIRCHDFKLNRMSFFLSGTLEVFNFDMTEFNDITMATEGKVALGTQQARMCAFIHGFGRAFLFNISIYNDVAV